MKSTDLIPTLRTAALGAIAAFTLSQPVLRAADHRDGSNTAHDAATDLADVYFFPDPVTTDNLVVIATFHGFIVPGEAANEAIFDPLVNYRFEFYNEHVNTPVPVDPGVGATPAQKAMFKRDTAKFRASIKPARTIDVSFTARTANPGPTGKEALQVTQPQTANLVFTGFKGQVGFSGSPRRDKATGLPVLNPSLGVSSPAAAGTALPLLTGQSTLTGISFFAGEADDPFFFDIPGFSRTVAGIRDGNLPQDFGTNPQYLGRGRDTFAGYNALSIALSIPKAALSNADAQNKPVIGLNVIAQRKGSEIVGRAGVLKAAGAFKSVDRMGNPAINVAFVPFTRKNEYNASTPKDDASGKFAGDIVATIKALNGSVMDSTVGTLAGIAVFSGDLLKLNPTAAVGWPNGRKLTDDVIDTALSVLFEGTVKDNVNANDVPFSATFPFLAPTQQPRDPSAVPLTDADDNTRN